MADDASEATWQRICAAYPYIWIHTQNIDERQDFKRIVAS